MSAGPRSRHRRLLRPERQPRVLVDERLALLEDLEHLTHLHAAILAAAGRIVNAIPDVLAAETGIRTTLDMPLVTGRGLYGLPS